MEGKTCVFNCIFAAGFKSSDLNQANLAQLVEHFIRNERVVGSIPIVGSLIAF
jgi:hypothetical protein